MNIGIVTTWFERGASYVSKQYMEILEKEFNVFIYARSGEKYAIGDAKWDSPNVYWSKKINSPFTVTVIKKKEFSDWIKKNNIGAVLFNEQHWWLPLIWCREMGVKTIAYIDYYTEETVPLFTNYDRLICNTKKHYEAFKWHDGAVYIPWGTDVDLYKPKDEQAADYVRFFHSCGMNPRRKGTDLLIKALEYIQSTKYRLIIHTQINLLKFYPDLANVINENVNSGRLEIIHQTISAPGLYHLADIYVYPSRLDGIGLTIAEAVSSGLGIIVPNCGPMNEFVNDKFGKKVLVGKYFSRSDGYYWPQNEVDILSLAESMSSFIDLTTQEILEVKKSAREYAIKSLNWEDNEKQIIDLFKSLNLSSSTGFSDKIEHDIMVFENRGLRKFNRYYIKYPLFRLLMRLIRK